MSNPVFVHDGPDTFEVFHGNDKDVRLRDIPRRFGSYLFSLGRVLIC